MKDDKQFLDYMVDIVQKTGQQIIDQKAKEFSQQIKMSAENFLNIIKNDMQKLKQIEKSMQRQKNAVRGIQQGKIQSSYEYRTQIQNRHLMVKKDFYREMVTATLKFQSELNQLLDQKVELIYVYMDENNNPSLYSLSESELAKGLSYQRNKKEISGRFRQDINFQKYLTESHLAQYDLYKDFNLQYFNWTYKEVIWRFNYGRKKNKANLILWLNPNINNQYPTKWLKAKVSNTGDIKQAYASVILDRKINSKKLFNHNFLDENVNDFMQQLAKVDNESGLLKGDVTVGQIEYAIKGVSASTLKMNQVIQLAEKICGKQVYTKKDLEEQKQDYHKKMKTRNHIQKIARKSFSKKQKELADRIEAKNRVGMNVLIKYDPQDIF